MTVGQRIAQKRKELGLSQEGLGEQLGVSRQAIYKWESDATLPEIEKLVALSRIFSVPVGWLLGVEEELPEGSAPENGELTETQLQMVKEIVDGYLAARPEPEPTPLPKRRRWPWVLATAAAVVLIVVLSNLFGRLDRLDNQYSNLQYSISNIQNNVNRSISSITDRVEEVLKAQNNLTADYTTELVSVEPAAGMATFSYRVVPKTYEEGMVAWIDVMNEAARITFGPYAATREVFSGDFTVALSDSTAIYIVFELDGVRQTQLLDTYTGLYQSTLPPVWLDAWPFFFDVEDQTNTLTDDLYAKLETDGEGARVASYRVGLFADRELVVWFTPTTQDIMLNGVPTQEETHILPKDSVVLAQGKEYCVAAVVVDEYGRQFVVTDIPIHWTGDGWTPVNSYNSGPWFEGWTY
ncbi:MAG: helix-turn-helix domain-containing protein [Candidatus Enterenecus sp.]